MTSRQMISTVVKRIVDGSLCLIETPTSPTGYSWKPMNSGQDGDADETRGVPASLFEIALWEVIEEQKKKIELLKELLDENSS